MAVFSQNHSKNPTQARKLPSILFVIESFAQAGIDNDFRVRPQKHNEP
jgi:hypothetical protein